MAINVNPYLIYLISNVILEKIETIGKVMQIGTIT
jgi:hypothetical protein